MTMILGLLEPRLLLNGAALLEHDHADHDSTCGYVVDLGGHTAAPLTADISANSLPLSSIERLHSRPSAAAKLYLDFDGQASFTWGYNTVPDTPAYSLDADTSTFTESELAAIREVWERVSEKFSPFNVDVTTEDPGNRDDLKTLHVVIGGDGSWASSTYTGIAKVGGFYSSSSNTVFVFEERLANGWPKYVGEIAAHEAGHGFGLSHQSRYSGSTRTEDYHTGDGTKAPIMGNSTGAQRGVWWNGTTSSSTTFQDDLAVLSGSSNAFGYRADDHGGTTGSATALSASGSIASGAGVIAQASDLDYFSFTTIGGSVSIDAAVPAAWAMLDLKLELRNSSNAVVASASTTSWGESITTSLAAGTYYVVVATQGQYGDLGTYTVSVTLPSGTSAPVANAGGPYTVNEGAAITLNASGSTGSNLVYAWDLDGDGIYGETGAGATRGSETGATPTFSAAGLDGPATASISLRVTDDQARTSTASASISISNVAPKLTISGNNSVNEGSVYTLGLSRSDVGPDTITSWTINWGDGTSPQVVIGDPSSVTHTFADNGTRTISATATDEDGTFAAGSTKTVTVNNVAPTIALSGNASVNEGESYSLMLGTITDPGTDTVTQWIIEWGDGATTTYTTGGAKSHTYADGPANRNIVVRLVDEDGTHVAGSKALSVNNVPPTLTIGGNDAVNEGSVYTLNLSRTDVGSDLLSAWTINWGDGQTQTIDGKSTFVTHVYADNATRTISATATDEDGTYAASNTKAVTVNKVAPSLSLGGAGSATAGATFNLLMSSSDPGADTITSWLINWGDGAVQTLSGNPSSAGHAYAAAGTYTITATATDEDGSYDASRSLSVTSDVPTVTGKQWIGPATGGDWSNPANWSPAGVPSRDDKVTLTDVRVSLSSNVAIAGLTLKGTAALDVRDHALVIDYGEVGPLEMWDGKGYTGISGMIAAGTVLSSAAAQGESVAAVEARDALRLSTTATASWSGMTVDGSSVLVKLTLGGDANLNSQVNVDDYGQIDASVGSLIQQLGWFNGDFNLDGSINVDDYGIIDRNQAP